MVCRPGDEAIRRQGQPASGQWSAEGEARHLKASRNGTTPSLATPRSMHASVHRSFSAIRNSPSRLKTRVRIGGRVSSRNPVLASTDETRALEPRKCFYGQTWRLKVRAHGILTDSI